MTLPYLYIFEVCICIHANLDRCLSDSWFQYQIIYSEWNTLINSLTIFGQRIYKLPQTLKSCVRMKSFRLALKHFISAARFYSVQKYLLSPFLSTFCIPEYLFCLITLHKLYSFTKTKGWNVTHRTKKLSKIIKSTRKLMNKKIFNSNVPVLHLSWTRKASILILPS